MSKHQANTTIWSRLRRGLAGVLSLALLLGLLPLSVFAARADTQSWAMPYVNTLVDWGVMRGDVGGNMAPDRSITRAEFVTMMNRAYGYSRLGGHPFTDVHSWDWYAEDVDIAYNMGYFKGTSLTTASPNDPLTREQAAVLLARNMMLQTEAGEVLGFSDSRTLSEWSRNLVGAAASSGLINGYDDGSFRPQNNISRGEVAAMLVRAIGTPINTEGDHALGSVYGNVTVNTSGVTLRDGVISGNLYLTGGIDLGDVLLENVTVLGEIVVSGGGESNSSQSSVVLRNVTADSMLVDSINQQFVTIRAEGNTDIKSTTVRTNAYVDDYSLPGYGLWKIIQDGGSLLQLAGNIKEVLNRTPDSETQVVQGTANKVTMDEKATNSSVLVDGGVRVDELDLDVATKVTGEGDIKDLNVGAAGSTVEQLPDHVTIRPGIDANINGGMMNSEQAAESSVEPRLEAGYPKAKNIAPTSADLVFKANKTGTIYWAVSAVADGSVSEDNLIEPPSYGGKILKSGTINVNDTKKEFTATVNGLTQDGSYYISAILVDARGHRSSLKVAAFATPDGTKPAFIGNPVATLRSVKTAQVTGMPNKSCRLFWALLPEGAAAPTPAEFKANAVRGNVGYGSMDVTKNVSQSVNVNRGNLKEKTNYVAYLWLTDHDGAQSSQVYRVPIYIPDQTAPEVHAVQQTNSNATAVEVSFTMNETGKLHWAIVTDEMHSKGTFIDYEGVEGEPAPASTPTNAYLDFGGNDDAELAAKIAVTAGTQAGAIVGGTTNVTSADTITRVLMSAARGLDPEVYNTSTFYMYYVGEDSERPSNMSEHIGVKEVNVRDVDGPVLEEQRFDTYNPSDLEHPLATTSIDLVFSESIRNGPGTDQDGRFWDLYEKVDTLVKGGAQEDDQALKDARDALAKALYNCIKLYAGDSKTDVASDQNPDSTVPNVLDYRYAVVSRENGTGRMVISFPHNTGFKNAAGEEICAANLKSGVTYHFEVYNIHDCASPKANPMAPDSDCMKDHIVNEFRVAFAQVELKNNGLLPEYMYNAVVKDQTGNFNKYFEAKYEDGTLIYPVEANLPQNWKDNPPQRRDAWFTVKPVDKDAMKDDLDSRYDILFWADRDVEVSLYSRPIPTGTEEEQDKAVWTLEGTAKFDGTAMQTEAAGGNGFVYRSLMRDFRGQNRYDMLSTMDADREYAIHVDMLHFQGRDNYVSGSWYDTVKFRISVVAGSSSALEFLNQGTRGNARYNEALKNNDLSSLGVPDYEEGEREFSPNIPPNISDVHIENNATRPKITVTLDNPGFVNYLIIELENLKYQPTGSAELIKIPSNQRITEAMLTEPTNQYYIRDYSSIGVNVYQTGTDKPSLSVIPNVEDLKGVMGRSVAEPSPSSLAGTVYPTVFRQWKTAKAGALVPQEITYEKDMKPNTVYLLCVVPQGSEDDTRSRATETKCFRFTTDAVTAPVLTLSEKSSINVNANVDVDAMVRARLLVQINLEDKTVFSKTLNDAGLNDNPDLPVGNYGTYTVMRALQAKVNDGTGRSVFDVFASDDLKQSMSDIINQGSGGSAENFPANTFYDNWGPNQVRAGIASPTDFDDSEQDDDTTYFCLGMAYLPGSQETGPWSFHALSDLTKVVDQTPKVNGITNALEYHEDKDDPAKNYMDGSVTISFTTQLYLANPNGKGSPLPMAVTSKPATGTGADIGTIVGAGGEKYVPLGPNMTTPKTGISIAEAGTPYTKTRSITFNVSGMKSKIFTVTIPEVWSKWNRSSGGTTTVTITYLSEGNWKIDVTPNSRLLPGYNPNA